MHRSSHVNSVATRLVIHRMGVFLVIAVAVVAALLLLYRTVIAAPGVKEVTITTVDDLQIGGCDDNDATTACSLRDAIVAANANKRIQTINIPDISGTGITTFTLTIQGSDEDAAKQGDLDIKKDLEIVGQGAGKTIIVGLGDRVIEVLPNVSLTLSDLTISGGTASDVGGGIRNRGDLVIANSVIAGNRAGGNGGAIWSEDFVSVSRSAIVNNVASGSGGAIYVDGGSVSVRNSTISGNSAGISGGAIHNAQSSSLNLSFVTLAGNSASQGGGLINAGSSTYDGVIFAGNAPDDCRSASGTTTSNGYNLFVANTSCSTDGATDATTSDALLAPLSIVPVEDGSGETYVHELLGGSPAADKIPTGTNGCGTVVVTDQRGKSRPLGTKCEIGAYEALLAQTGPIFENNTIDVTYDGVCGFDHCNLREAIEAANNKENDGDAPDEIHFNIPGSDPNAENVILVTSALPPITDPVIISGTTQLTGTVVLQWDGSDEVDATCDASGFDGLTIIGGDSVVSGLEIRSFPGDGVAISTSGGNTIVDNYIHDNGGAGVCVSGVPQNRIRANDISGNATGISLANNGNQNQQPPTLSVSIVRTADYTPTSDIGGYLNGAADTTYEIDVFSNPSCTGAQGHTYLASSSMTTDAAGLGEFLVQGLDPLAIDSGATATVTDPAGNTSEFSVCDLVETLNDSWLTAKAMANVPPPPGTTLSQVIYQEGQGLWFKFPVTEDGKVTLSVTGKPGMIVTMHRDLFEEYSFLENEEDSAVLAANSLPGGYLPGGYLPGGYLPGGYLPGGYLPGGYLPGGYLPGGYLPGGYLPGGYLPGGYLPGGYLPGGYLPGGYLPPDVLPGGYLPELYSHAVRGSLIAVANDPAATDLQIVRNTWDMNEDLYVLVSGAASLSEETTVSVTYNGGLCNAQNLLSPFDPDEHDVIIGDQPTSGHKTLIVWDSDRMVEAGSPQIDVDILATELISFANRSDINGAVIDLAATEGGQAKYPRVNEPNEPMLGANAIADANPSCVTAKNDVAEEIKRVIDEYRAVDVSGDLEFVLLVGSDDQIPFFRYPDESGLANENEYEPPVGALTPSEAALRRGQVLGQDAYGSAVELSRSGYSVPLPDLAVGRLVRTAGQVMGMIDAYESTGGLVTPGSALTTGYDFVADVGEAVLDEFNDGLTGTVDALITPQDDGLEDAWTADDLRAELFDKRHDLIFTAGHFTAGSLVAADYQTEISASEVSTGDFANSIILGLGCHGGYNIPELDSIVNSPDPDWPEIFLANQATLVASTGYAYGDTELLGYGELLFLNLIQQLRTDEVQEVALGKALVAAKLDYFAGHPTMEGIDDKTVLEHTLFGFPMLKVNMPGTRISTGGASVVSAVAPQGAAGLYTGQSAVSGEAGLAQAASTLGQMGTIHITTDLTRFDTVLTDTLTKEARTVTYFTGQGNEELVVARPAEPIFPLERRIVDVPEFILRGVGFYGGSYTDTVDITPHTSAPTTENSRARPAFFSDVKYPTELTSANHADTASGLPTSLNITAGQYESASCASLSGTMRTFGSMDLLLYYLDADWASLPVTDTVRLAGIAAAAEITDVSSSVVGSSVQFTATVQSDPASQAEKVWLNWTDPDATGADGSNSWQPLDLAQISTNQWGATANVPASALFSIHAVTAGGLVSQNTNDGAFFEIGTPEPPPPQDTSLSFAGLQPDFGAFGRTVTFTVELSDASGGVAGQQIILSLGGQRVCADTDTNGIATFNVTLSQSPGQYLVHASFRGDSAAGLAPSVTGQEPFEILRDTPTLILESLEDGFVILSGEENDITARLTDSDGDPLLEKTITFVATDQGGSDTELPVGRKTDLGGRVALGIVDTLASGQYVLTARFEGFNEGDAEGLFDDVLLYNEAITMTTITVNSRPLADAGGPYQVDEGSSVSLDGSNSADEGSLVSYEWLFAYDGGELALSGIMPTLDAASLDGPLTGTLTLTVTDNLGATDVDATTLTVDNVAPVVEPIDAVNDPAVTFGITATAVFSDAGVGDTHTALWDWGDGTSSAGTVTEVSGSGTVADSHTYSAAGFYTITLTISDDDGGQGQAVLRNFLVFEAGVGKVSGGGRSSVPADACGADGAPYCTSGGNANIAFDVQYTSGSDIPSGQTTFNFKGGSLDFSSVDAYDTLVVIDDLAIFWGQGTLSNKNGNAVSAFFEVTAFDADIDTTDDVDTDRFGIKIWYFEGGQKKVVVDTSLSAAAYDFGLLDTTKGSSIKIF